MEYLHVATAAQETEYKLHEYEFHVLDFVTSRCIIPRYVCRLFLCFMHANGRGRLFSFCFVFHFATHDKKKIYVYIVTLELLIT